MERVLFAKNDHLVGQSVDFFGLGLGGFDLLVFEQGGDQRTERRPAVAGPAPKFAFQHVARSFHAAGDAGLHVAGDAGLLLFGLAQIQEIAGLPLPSAEGGSSGATDLATSRER
jgi:hypothetical protein